MTPLTPYAMRLIKIGLAIALLVLGGFAASKIGVSPSVLIDAGVRLLKEADPPEVQAQPSPSPTPTGPAVF